uniref:DJ-1/PfpI domain-containing protein n=1 Tax=Pyrodinium bahamense TaxID=73915 RepID=A0A7S0A3B7_9DINO|mmetsp:Transcript_20725/g.57360  ORF Transcript_20725/g.57360 Transcript_20725/m.57360 type:complete len:306 (+) Transcript_20725:75-992(+)
MAPWNCNLPSAGVLRVVGIILLMIKAASAFAPAALAFQAPAGRTSATQASAPGQRLAVLPAQPKASSYTGVGTSSMVVASFALATISRKATLGACLRSRSRRCRRARGHVQVAAAPVEGSTFRVLVPVANDSEEIETACITDVLTRAGAEVTVASVEPELEVRMSRGLKVVADMLIGDCVDKQWDAIACPGGMPGAERLRDSAELTALLKEQHASGRVTAAVCASPAVIFAKHGLIGTSATSYPAPAFKELVGDVWTDAQAVVDGNVITSQGPGTSLQFALKIVEELYGKEKAEELAAQMVTQIA